MDSRQDGLQHLCMILHLQVREAAERKTWTTRFRGVGKAPEAGKRAYQIFEDFGCPSLSPHPEGPCHAESGVLTLPLLTAIMGTGWEDPCASRLGSCSSPRC